jgi:hypothetical protein
MDLRQAAIDAMAGRKWYEGAVRVQLRYLSPEVGSAPALHPYLNGILDTLGGSHGPSFIYLPIVYLDDCQAVICELRGGNSLTERYEVEIEFLSELLPWQQANPK